jgi:RTX calcium-binding nonapeptide repeat (4 copies)
VKKALLAFAALIAIAVLVLPLGTSGAQEEPPCDVNDPASPCYEPPPPPPCNVNDPASECYEPPEPPCDANNPESDCYEPPPEPEPPPRRGGKHHGGDSHCKPKGKGETCTYKRGPRRIVATRYNDIVRSGSGATTIHGMTGSDKLFGGAGSDIVLGDELGKGGNDFVDGGPGNDRVFGMAGNDQVHGGPGNDVVHGGTGTDHMYGDAGNDTLDDAPRGGPSGSDWFYGGAGSDDVFSRDRTRDYVDCGAGGDVAKVDGLDVVAGNCEQVVRAG